MGKRHKNLIHDIGVSKVHLDLGASIKINVLLNGDLSGFALAAPRVHFPTYLFDEECNEESNKRHESRNKHSVHQLRSH